MKKPEFKPFYDVIIIGAGVGGLTAAAFLSKAGMSVCVLEKEPHPGGYLAGFRRKDFRFDTAIHWLNQCGPNGMVNKLFAALGNDFPRPVIQKRIKRFKGDDFDYLLTNNPDELRDRLIREFPHDKKGIIRFFRAARRIGLSFYNSGNVLRSEHSMSFFKRMRNKIRLLKFALPFIPYVMYSGEKGMKRGLSKFFKDPAIHKIFSAESELLGCLVPIGWAYYSDFQCPPRGGGQVIPEWLEHVVQFFEGETHYKCTVTRILLDGTQSKGVAIQSRGNEYEIQSKYVIAACDIEMLYEKMLPENAVPKKLKKKLREAELYSSSVTISIALDCPTENLGFGEEMVQLVGKNDSKADYSSGDPHKSEIIILPPSTRDSSLAPQGCGTLTLFMPALMNQNENWLTEKDSEGNYVRGEAYKKLKTEIAEVVISRVEEKVAPGLRDHILFYDVATPVTHWRYTGNKDGTMMGAKPGKKNMQSGVAHYKTPVKNLLLGGHWAELGGGVPIAAKAGANAALMVLKKENRPAFRVMADYMEEKITLEEYLKSPAFKPYQDDTWIKNPTPAEKLLMKQSSSSAEPQ